MPNFLLSDKAKIYYGPEGSVISAMTAMTGVRDVSYDVQAAEVDVSTRDGNGWEGIAPGLLSGSFKIGLIWRPGDAAFDAINGALLGRTLLEMAFTDQAKATSGATGPKGTFTILGMSKSEDIKGVQLVEMTAKMSAYDQWLTL